MFIVVVVNVFVISASPCSDVWIVVTDATAECSILFLNALEVLAVVAELFWFHSYFTFRVISII